MFNTNFWSTFFHVFKRLAVGQQALISIVTVFEGFVSMHRRRGCPYPVPVFICIQDCTSDFLWRSQLSRSWPFCSSYIPSYIYTRMHMSARQTPPHMHVICMMSHCRRAHLLVSPSILRCIHKYYTLFDTENESERHYCIWWEFLWVLGFCSFKLCRREE
jgi:hypothetical protein